MAWVEAYQELPEHPKTKRLARMLKISIPEAVGHLVLLWWWALTYAQDGNISKYDVCDIADAVRWDGDPDEFMNAMIHCGGKNSYGFIEDIDGVLCIHDWDIYTGRRAVLRKKNRQRRAKSAKSIYRSEYICPSCGAPIDIRKERSCPHCGTAVCIS